MKALLRRRVTKNRHGDSSDDHKFCFPMTLPFLPAIGTEITHDDVAVVVSKLWYDAKEEILHVFDDTDRAQGTTYDELIGDLDRAGWLRFNGSAQDYFSS